MNSFVYYAPTRIYFGENTEETVGNYAAEQGAKRVLVVYGGQSAVKSGLLDRVTASLAAAGLAFETLGGVQPNPRLQLARQGVEKALSFGADFLLAVGGGSVIDTAKAIADGAANPHLDLWNDLWLKKVPLTASLPVGVVLTIPAAGSESSDSAVLTNETTHEKRGLSSDFHRPRFAVLNPALTLTLPRYQVTCGIVDIMMHTMDRYFNPITTNALTDEIAEGLLRNTIRFGRLAVENPGAVEPMSELMWAGSLSHNGLTGLGNKNDFAPHQLGHELSAMFDVAHGASLSAIWDSWARYCIGANPSRFARFAEKVWGIDTAGMDPMEAGLAGIDATKTFFETIDMPVTLSQVCGSVQAEAVIDELAYRCAFGNTRTIGTFRVLNLQDIRNIYQLANH